MLCLGRVAGLISAAVGKARELAAGTMIGTGTVSNQDLSAGYACLMEARLVEQVETGAAKTPFLDFGDTVKIEMLDTQGARVFGAIEHGVERYRPLPAEPATKFAAPIPPLA